MSERGGPEEQRPLPAAVRTRVVTLAADALGDMPADQVPPSLKRVAAFAPQRRARLAANQIAAALETDEEFRSSVASRVREGLGQVAEAVDGGTTPRAADPVEVAAVAYLLRPPGWEDHLKRAEHSEKSEQLAAVEREAGQELTRLQQRLAEAEEAVRERESRRREQVARLKSENNELRHRLGETRARLRQAESAAREAQERLDESLDRAATTHAARDAELRRLRGRIEELERDVTALRRTDKAERGQEAMRARLLLDALLDAAQGLRRELALPPVEGSPADVVSADVAQQGARTSSGHGSLAGDDPALLEQLLGLPRVHLVVDGYNVTKSAWPDLPLERQRDRLLGGLAPLQARTRAEVTVVFDAAERAERPIGKVPRALRVLFSPVGVLADDVIRDLVAAEPQGRPVVVVTSDQAVVTDVRRAGARVVGSAALSRLMTRS